MKVFAYTVLAEHYAIQCKCTTSHDPLGSLAVGKNCTFHACIFVICRLYWEQWVQFIWCRVQLFVQTQSIISQRSFTWPD